MAVILAIESHDPGTVTRNSLHPCPCCRTMLKANSHHPGGSLMNLGPGTGQLFD